jgi:hypothetical protein
MSIPKLKNIFSQLDMTATLPVQFISRYYLQTNAKIISRYESPWVKTKGLEFSSSPRPITC